MVMSDIHNFMSHESMIDYITLLFNVFIELANVGAMLRSCFK